MSRSRERKPTTQLWLCAWLCPTVQAACGFQPCVSPSFPKIDAAPLLCFIETAVGGRGQVRSCRDLSACCNNPSPQVCIWLSGELRGARELCTQADEELANGGMSLARRSLCLYLLAPQAVMRISLLNGGRRDLVFVFVCYMNLVPSRSPMGSSKRTCFTVGFCL